ncbi:MAG: GNAT family N-acetyltransferase [Planctomycetes bacterium]|nr:GNAT family N-acetyltransferase [Planctomycetota bacterium]
MEIKLDDLLGKEIAEFLEAHVEEMKSISPPESKHALDLESLRKPEVTFWSAWQQGAVVGCGALMELAPDLAEIKSMRTGEAGRGKGVASELLKHILSVAKERGFARVSLETGSMDFFEPARGLYAKFGFSECGPFGDYIEDPNSAFMSRLV